MLPHFQWIPLVSDIFITTLQGEQGRSAMWLKSTINREKRDTQRRKKKFAFFRVVFVVLQFMYRGRGWLQTIGGFLFFFFFFRKPKCVWEGHDKFCVTPFDFARNGSSRSLVSVWGPGTDSGRLVESFTFLFAFFFLRFSFNTGIPIIRRHQRISLSWKPLAPSLVVDNFTQKSKTKRAQKRLDAAAFFCI